MRGTSRKLGAAEAPDLELAFVLAPRQNLFFTELVEALRAEAHGLGVRTSLHTGNFPPPEQHRAYVLVPPHEYFALMGDQPSPSDRAMKRTIFICAEQPGTSFFNQNVAMAPRAGAVFDINRHAIRAFAAREITAHHLQIGWTQSWDHLRERERDIDILFMGCISERRERALSHYARVLARHQTCLVISDNSRPNWAPSESFRTDEEKWDLLGRSKVLLNVHQGSSPYFEWLRITQAMINGAVVISEHSLDYEPLVAGSHFLSGSVESLGLLAEMLLGDGHRWWEMQTAAYHEVRNQLPLRAGVERLVEIAAALVAHHPAPRTTDPCFAAGPTAHVDLFTEESVIPSPSLGDHNAAILRQAAKSLKLDLLDVRRHVTKLELALAQGRTPPTVELVAKTPGYAKAAPRVSILMALHNYDEYVVGACDSLLRSHEDSWELIVVDDGSTDRSRQVVQSWMHRHDDTATLLLRHPVNRGLARARNSALSCARGEFCFVLDADNEIYPQCLPKLIEALERDHGAAFAYGIFQRFRHGQSDGLLNKLPWEPRRLRIGNYIDAMALIRTDVLRKRFGGYATDRQLYGWEDYELWCRLAENGLRGAFVPQIVARYRTTAHSMLSITNISATEAYSVIMERNPLLMAGMKPPA